MRQDRGILSELSPCSAVLTVICVIAFFSQRFLGDRVYEAGAFSAMYLLHGREYYRLISSIFLHADEAHLVNNCILLYFGGEILERSIGKVRYLILFFSAGICGNLLSAAYEVITDSYYLSIGASGAVFGLMGGLLYLVIIHRGEAAMITPGRMIFMLVLSLYNGFTRSYVNNAAHIGGLISGFLITFVLCQIGRLPGSRER